MRDQSVKIYSLQLRVVGAFVVVVVVLVGVARVVAVGAVDELVVESVAGVVTGGVVVVLVGRLFLQFTPRFAARSAQRVSVTLRTENVWRAGSRETVMSTKRSCNLIYTNSTELSLRIPLTLGNAACQQERKSMDCQVSWCTQCD